MTIWKWNADGEPVSIRLELPEIDLNTLSLDIWDVLQLLSA